MSILIIAVILILSALSLVQRVVPWLLYRKFTSGNRLPMLFELVAVSAFASLMVSNISSFSLNNLIPLVPALLVAYRTKNLGATVLVALVFSLLLAFL